MRVTKVIREYVESEVKRKFASSREAVEAEYDSVVDPVKQKIIEIAREANDRAVAIATEAGLYDQYAGELIRANEYRVQDGSARKTRLVKLAEIADKEQKAVSDIIIGLELGETTKDELRSAIDAIVV